MHITVHANFAFTITRTWFKCLALPQRNLINFLWLNPVRIYVIRFQDRVYINLFMNFAICTRTCHITWRHVPKSNCSSRWEYRQHFYISLLSGDSPNHSIMFSNKNLHRCLKVTCTQQGFSRNTNRKWSVRRCECGQCKHYSPTWSTLSTHPVSSSFNPL